MGDLKSVRFRPLPTFLLALVPVLLPARAAAASDGLAWEDTVLAVRRGQVLIGEGFSGRITVQGWDRDRVELVEEGGDSRVVLRVVGNRLVLGGAGTRRRGAGTGNVLLRVPSWMPVQLRGGDLDATVEGLTAVVDLSSVEGDLELRDVAGDVFARTVEGSVLVDRARGRLRLRSVEEGVSVARVEADSLLIESTSGAIVMDDVDAGWIDATTTEGDISFSGDLRPGGTYRLSSHDGSLEVALAPSASAVVAVSTFDGEFLPGFPITLDRFQGGKEMSFTLGRGGARLRLNTFDGDIVLRRRAP